MDDRFVVSAIGSNGNGIIEYGIYRIKNLVGGIFKRRELVERFYAVDLGDCDYLLRRKIVGEREHINFAHLRDFELVNKVLLEEAKERVLVRQGKKKERAKN